MYIYFTAGIDKETMIKVLYDIFWRSKVIAFLSDTQELIGDNIYYQSRRKLKFFVSTTSPLYFKY